MLADAGRERPDILVAPADIYPVIVEVEFGEPALGDARAKLGRLVVGTNDRVRAEIAVVCRRQCGAGWSCAWPSSTPARRTPTLTPVSG